MERMSNRGGWSMGLAALGCAPAIADCGGSSAPGTGTGTSAANAAPMELSKCMRAHGVPNFPDPTFPSTGGVQLRLVPGVDPNSPAFNQARAACGRGTLRAGP